jgi:hypothetical protein
LGVCALPAGLAQFSLSTQGLRPFGKRAGLALANWMPPLRALISGRMTSG